MTEIAHVLPPSDTRSRHSANADIRRNYNDYEGVKSTHRRLWLFGRSGSLSHAIQTSAANGSPYWV